MALAWPGMLERVIADALASVWGELEYNWSLPLGSDYGTRIDPIEGQRRDHRGIDIPVARGTPVLAVYDGHIDRIDELAEVNGNAVFLAAGPWRFCYLHLDTVAVHRGQRVQRGAMLGTVGRTGRATGYHLHFQVYLAGALIDPLILYPGRLFKQV